MNEKIIVLCSMLTALCDFCSAADAQQPGKSSASVFWMEHCFRYCGPRGRIPARAEQAWLDRREKHHHRVPVCREQKPERLPELAANLVRLKVDLIVVTTAQAALAAKSATTTIPIVMTNAADPVGAGLVASLARPGGNVTGLSSLAPELNTKRLEILKDAVPKLVELDFYGRRGTGLAYRPPIERA